MKARRRTRVRRRRIGTRESTIIRAAYAFLRARVPWYVDGHVEYALEPFSEPERALKNPFEKLFVVKVRVYGTRFYRRAAIVTMKFILAYDKEHRTYRVRGPGQACILQPHGTDVSVPKELFPQYFSISEKNGFLIEKTPQGGMRLRCTPTRKHRFAPKRPEGVQSKRTPMHEDPFAPPRRPV